MDATTQLEQILDTLQPQLTAFICGDFNARIGNNKPDLDSEHPPRQSIDSHVCTRASWLLSLCELYDYYILNGIYNPATYTCHTSRGKSVIDYILCTTPSYKLQTETSRTY